MQSEVSVIAPINKGIVIIPFNETQNLTMLTTTLVAYVDGCWRFLCLKNNSNPQAHGITIVALHRRVFQGIVFFLEEAMVKITWIE